jgi:hypothetical protein
MLVIGPVINRVVPAKGHLMTGNAMVAHMHYPRLLTVAAPTSLHNHYTGITLTCICRGAPTVIITLLGSISIWIGRLGH